MDHFFFFWEDAVDHFKFDMLHLIPANIKNNEWTWTSKKKKPLCEVLILATKFYVKKHWEGKKKHDFVTLIHLKWGICLGKLRKGEHVLLPIIITHIRQ